MHALDIGASKTADNFSWRFFMGRLAPVKRCRQPRPPLAFRTPSGATGKSADLPDFAAGGAMGLAKLPRPEDGGKRD